MRYGITNNRQLQTGNLNSEPSGYIRKKKKLPTTTETKYSRMDQAKFVEDNFKHILSS